MNRLLWKEYRDQRLVLITGATILLLPHLAVLGAYVIGRCLVWYGTIPDPNVELAESLMGATAASVIYSLLTLALLGGNLIAGERSDRSAEFLAILPISRARIVRNKLALALGVVTVILGWNLLIVLAIGMPAEVSREFWSAVWTAEFWEFPGGRAENFRRIAGVVATTGLTFFCVGWFFSSFSPSSVLAIAGGLLTPALVWVVEWMWGHKHSPAYRDFNPAVISWYVNTCLVLALVCFVAGTWHYLRRVEP